ncbi:MAG: DNA-directed RNA polymerase sigma-70 factor [Bacteroidia bacterium]|nr:MAG: DNA-directed RNA polymerase sigma-70 factor [Bacteroidia bacterium]
MMTSEIDKKILELIAQSDKQNQALKLLIDTYQKRLYWQVRRIVINHDDADDALQNTFIKAWQGLKNFNQNSSLFTWLYRIATNEALQVLRKNAQHNHISYEHVAQHLSNSLVSDPYFKGDEIQRKFQQAILSLPEKQRLVFNMRYYDELSYEEIAEILDTSVGALKASYHHAVKKIEEILLNQIEN